MKKLYSLLLCLVFILSSCASSKRSANCNTGKKKKTDMGWIKTRK